MAHLIIPQGPSQDYMTLALSLIQTQSNQSSSLGGDGAHETKAKPALLFINGLKQLLDFGPLPL